MTQLSDPLTELNNLRRKIFFTLGPFWLYLFLAVALNVYPIAAAIRAGVEYNGDVGECRRAMAWMYTNQWLCVVNIVVAFYIAFVGRNLTRRWAEEYATATAGKVGGKDVSSGSADAAALSLQSPQQQQQDAQEKQQSPYVRVEDDGGETLDDITTVAASAPTTVDVLKNLSSRCILRIYFILLLIFLCWTTTGLKRHMMKAGYCGGNIRGHVADSVLCGVLFLVLGQSALCFGAWRAGRVMAQGRVSGLSRPAHGFET